jgi:threonine dehydrogenase-like Zn-dependent dehydrogenase
MSGMRAAVFRGPGIIEPADTPEPVLAQGDLLVEVAACGVCGSDLESWRSGAYVSAGQVMGHEIGGRVVSGGEAVGLAAGAAVALRPLRSCGECPR